MLGTCAGRELTSTSHGSLWGPPDSIQITHQPKAAQRANLGGLPMLCYGAFSVVRRSRSAGEQAVRQSSPRIPEWIKGKLCPHHSLWFVKSPCPGQSQRKELVSVSLVSLISRPLPPPTILLNETALRSFSVTFLSCLPSLAPHLPLPDSSFFGHDTVVDGVEENLPTKRRTSGSFQKYHTYHTLAYNLKNSKNCLPILSDGRRKVKTAILDWE